MQSRIYCKYSDMKFVLVCIIACATVLVASAAPQYTTKYDGIDLDQIFKSKRLLLNYSNCLLERDNAPCTPDAKELKASLPDALENDCSKCSERQKDGAEKTIRFLSKNEPEIWHELKAKYDPNNKYQEKYDDKAKDLGIVI